MHYYCPPYDKQYLSFSLSGCNAKRCTAHLKTVTDGTAFVNISILLYILREKNIFFSISRYSWTCYAILMTYSFNLTCYPAFEVTTIPPTASGNGRDKICKHFKHIDQCDWGTYWTSAFEWKTLG